MIKTGILSTLMWLFVTLMGLSLLFRAAEQSVMKEEGK